MDIILKCIIILIGIVLNILFFRSNKKLLVIGLISIAGAAIFSHILVLQIPLPGEEVTITALNKKNKDAIHFEVVLKGYLYEGKMIPIEKLKYGKWMYRSNQEYMWRDPSDIRQPDGITHSITFDVPIGMDRHICLVKNKWSGLAEIKTQNETKIMDLYQLDSSDIKIDIKDTSRKELYIVKGARLIIWLIILVVILGVIYGCYIIYKKYPQFIGVISISIIILLQLGNIMYYANQKQGYYVDEIYTMELANHYYEPFLTSREKYYEEWHDAQYYQDSLIPKENIFEYGSVIYNQSRDVHPPLYYLIYHTVSSFLPITISKWIGISINIVFFFISSILLYAISKRFFECRSIQLLPNILWGFSVAAVSSVMYIRMYVLLTATVLFFVWTYLRYVYNKELTKKGILMILISTYLGSMTQYYFLIFAFLFTGTECLIRIIRKEYSNCWRYGITNALAVILVFITFPAAYQHIFQGYRGKEAFSNISKSEVVIRNIKAYYDEIIHQLFGGNLGYLLFAIIFLIIGIAMCNIFLCKITVNRSNDKLEVNMRWFPEINFSIHTKGKVLFTIQLILVSVLFIGVVGLVAPYDTIRYIYCILPMVVLSAYLIIDYLVNKSRCTYYIINIVLIIVTVVFCAIPHITIKPDYLYQYHTIAYKIAEDNASIPVVLCTNNARFSSVGRRLELMIYEKSLIVEKSQSDKIPSYINRLEQEENKVMVYIHNTNKDERQVLLKQVINATDFKSWEELYNRDGYVIYRIYK